MLISSAAHSYNMPSSCLCEGWGPIVPVMENVMPFGGHVGVWWRCELARTCPEYFLFGWANSMIFFRSLTPDEREMYIQFVVLACALKGLSALACRSHSFTQPRIYDFFCSAVFTKMRAYFFYLVPCGKGRHCVASHFHKPSICILAIFSLDSAPNLSRWDRPLSQTYLVVAPRLLVWPLGRHSISTFTNLWKIYTISGPEFPNSRMSSAKRRSTNLSRVSPKWKPAFPVSFFHGPNTQSRGLKTQPCGTPPAMENLRLLPHSPAKMFMKWMLYQVKSSQSLDAVWRAHFGRRRWTKRNNIYKSVFTNRFTLGHAEVVERARKCQPCFLVLCVFHPMPELFVATEGCDLLIPTVPWPT